MDAATWLKNLKDLARDCRESEAAHQKAVARAKVKAQRLADKQDEFREVLNEQLNPAPLFALAAKYLPPELRVLAVCEQCCATRCFRGLELPSIVNEIRRIGWTIDGGNASMVAEWVFNCPPCADANPMQRDKDEFLA